MMAKPIRALQMHYLMIQFFIILLIHDTRHLCTRFRFDGIKAMSTGISGGKQVMRFACCEEDNYRRYCLQKVKMITSIHNLPLSSFIVISSVLHFLLARINKLNRAFLNWQILSLICLLRNHATLLLSNQFLKACKDGGYLEWGLLSRSPRKQITNKKQFGGSTYT